MGAYRQEMRYKNRLAQRGKGNRRKNRFVALSAGDFEKVDYFSAVHGIHGQDKRTSMPVVTHTATAQQVREAVASEQRHKAHPTYHAKASPFQTLRIIKLPDGKEVLQ